MSIIQHFNLNLIPESAPVVVHADQYDHGIGRLVIKLYNGDEPYSPVGSVMIQGTKPDGKGFAYTATLDGNTVTADLTEQMTAVSGDVRTQIVVTEESGRTGTFAFILNIQTSALPDGSDMSESEIAVLEELVESAEQSSSDAEAWANGTRGGVPVGPEDPAYENNSKWWAKQSHGGAGVTSFNMRSGSVLPMAGDYTASQIILASTMHIGGETQTDVQEALIALSQHGGGLYPYLYIDSEPGSTVTVTTPAGSTITPTAAGSGHWECELPSYGVYVIHSLLNGSDATMSLTVDDVKEYHVTDAHYDFTINVTADLGSTVRVQAGSEIYTTTGTGSAVAIVVHQESTQYTITETLDGYTDSATVTSAATTSQSTSVSLHVFTATLSLSTTSPELASATISIYLDASGTPTLIGTTTFVSSAASFIVHEPGTYTCSCTYLGEEYSSDVTVSTETTYPVVIDTIPEGSTVLPTDDIQTWLKCAGIRDKSYTTLSEVLADHDTLYLLMGNNNAVDYLVRSTTWASGITADEYAMKYIGKWNYASDTLLDDSTWGQAICDSAYFESVLNAKVPKLTSSTSQNVSSISDLQNYPAYQAFDRDITTAWIANYGQSSAGQTSNEGWIGYQFTEPIKCMFAEFTGRSDLPVQEYSFKASNDGTTFTEELASGTTLSSQTGVRIPFTNNNSEYAYYRMYLKQKNSSSGALVIPRVYELQFYGRQDVTENEIDIYSAASDTVYYTENGQDITVCTTDATGHGTVSKQDLPNGIYTLYSTVANDPDNLSNPYTKSITVTDGTVEIYVMPENCLYWYGYMTNLEVLSSTAGYQTVSQDYTGFKAPTINERNIYCSATATTESGMGSINPVTVPTNVYTIAQGSTVLNGTYGNVSREYTAKNSRRTGTIYATVNTTAKSKWQVNSPLLGDYYIGFSTVNVRSMYVYALWYD